jgi:hypothetical protein
MMAVGQRITAACERKNKLETRVAVRKDERKQFVEETDEVGAKLHPNLHFVSVVREHGQ